MGRPRSELQEILVTLLGSLNVYFQPPESVKMLYPCIRYVRDQANTRFADNSPYRHTKRYRVTVIDPDPDSEIPDKVAELPLCAFNRFYVANNLNHDVYLLYY